MTDNLSIKDRVLKDIRDGEVRMTPRAYFTLKLAVTVAAALAVLVVTVFIVNFILFQIEINSHEELLRFGPRGWRAFLFFFPWPLLLIDIALVAVLARLAREFKTGYQTPVAYLLGVLLIASVGLGFALERTPVNEHLARSSRLPPPMHVIYRNAQRPPEIGSGMCRCTILAIDGDELTVEDARAQASSTLKVILPADDRHATTTGLRVGDTVFIAGEEEDGVIRAFGVRKDRGDRGPGGFFFKRVIILDTHQ